jgi:small subunit ribosomal protein S16
LVAADEESPRDGRFLENLGHHNPRTFPATTVVDEARVFYWLGHGAQPSDSARRVLTSSGCWARWQRIKAGESLEAVLAEVKPAAAVDARTSKAGAASARPSKKARARAESAKAEPAPEA